jgi:putative ABC transport system permease protein
MWTLVGIVLATALITAIYGFAASGIETIIRVVGDDAFSRDRNIGTFIGFAVVLSAIIIATSINVISNAFRVSAAERTKQFGILKSVGATKRQISDTVLYECLYLLRIGIPVGIALGLFLEWVCTLLANYYLTDLNLINEGVALTFDFVFSFPAIALSAIVAFLTVLLSAWIPAAKASKTSAIDAIIGRGEIKMQARQFRTNSVTKKIFGFEGALASKSLKRNKRNHRASVSALTFSVIIFIVASSIIIQGSKMASLLYPGIETDLVVQFSSPIVMNYGDDGRLERSFSTINSGMADEITDKFREYPDTQIFGAGINVYIYDAEIPEGMLSQKLREYLASQESAPGPAGITFITLDSEHYAQMCRAAGIPLGSNILINNFRSNMDDKRTEFSPFVFDRQVLHIIESGEPVMDLPLHGELRVADIPAELMYVRDGYLSVIVPEFEALMQIWFVKTTDKAGFSEYADTILHEMIPAEVSKTEILDIEEAMNAIYGMNRLISVFMYGFVAVLVLIALTNVIASTSTNIRNRAREFAVLRSVGMTDSGLYRMLNLESIMSSVRSLIIGLPLGALLSYFLYRVMMNSYGFEFGVPWLAIIFSIIGVFAITWTTIRVAAARLKGASIIDTIRLGAP